MTERRHGRVSGPVLTPSRVTAGAGVLRSHERRHRRRLLDEEQMMFRFGHSSGARRDWLEIVVAVAISIAGLGTSWSAYQAAVWNGVQTLHYGRANGARVAASTAALKAAATENWEVGLLIAWLEAEEGGNDRLASFYAKRFPPDLKPAFDQWSAQKPLDNPDAAASPFQLLSYRNSGVEQAEALNRKADAEFRAGQDSNRTSIAFTQCAVILATAMFFGGIGQVFAVRGLRILLCAVSVTACLWGLGRILILPALLFGPPA
jgi:hypothetical protein